MNATLTNSEVRHHDGDRFNIAADSKTFDCKFLEPGFVSYRDVGGKLELLRKDTIERCMPTVVGNPVTIGHAEVTAENRTALEQGIVHEWYFNSEDGWYHVKGVIDTEPAKARINSGHRPSCGYQVLALGPGGVDHGIRYDQEIVDLVFNHLAIVERPRYAEAEFRLNSVNVSNPTSMKVFKFLKKLVTRENGADGKPVETVKTETHEISAETETEIDGTKVRLNELFDVYLAQTAAALTATPEDALEVSGKAVTMGELATAWRAHKARANAAPAKDVTKEPVKEPAKADETPEQKTARENEQKKNTDAFFSLSGARHNPAKTDGGFSTSSGSLKEKCAIGAKRY